MRAVTTPAQLDALTAPLLQAGAIASGSLSAGEFLPDMERGTLFCRESPEGLLLLRQRGDLLRGTFLLRQGAPAPQTELPLPAVLEIPRRGEDPERRRLEESFQTRGWQQLLRRVRLTRRPGPVKGTFPHPPAADPEQAKALLEESFSPLTGCLPQAEELTLAAREGRLLGDARGVLHFSRKGNTTEIRHLAVAPKARGAGIGSALAGGFLAREGGALCRVWTGQDNAPALALYHKLDFLEDGWTSAVLWLRKESTAMREQLLTLLTQCCPGVDFETETALVDDGLLESLDIVTIVSEIMNEFGVVIGVENLLPENFNSVDAMLELIRAKQA